VDAARGLAVLVCRFANGSVADRNGYRCDFPARAAELGATAIQARSLPRLWLRSSGDARLLPGMRRSARRRGYKVNNQSKLVAARVHGIMRCD
jgi:hypothetical protein